MHLVTWEPLKDIVNLQRELSRVFEPVDLESNAFDKFNFVPVAELQETPDTYQLDIEVPGVDLKDLDLQVTAQSVAISGERKSTEEYTEKGIKRSEFRYGKFQRIIPLPAKIQEEQVTAKYEQGILKITLPKAESAKSNVVKVDIK